MTADRSCTVHLKANVAGFVAGIEQAKLATKDFAKDAAKSAAEHGQSWEKVGKASMLTGGVILAGVGMAVKAYADFDKQMSSVKAVSGASAAQMDQLGKAAIKAGADTVFSASEAAKAEGELAKAGVKTSDILGGALTGSLNLASAGGLDLADAATIAAQSMNIFKLGGKDVAHIADVLASGANKSAADVGSLGDALKQGGLVAAQTGLHLEDTVGILSMFADNALIGSDAGTSLKTALMRLVPGSDAAQVAMDSIGFSAYDASGKFVGMESVAQQLKDGLGGLTEQQRASTLNTIFGSDATRAASILYEQGADGVKKYTEAMADNGAAARMSAVMLDNLAGDLEGLKGSIDTALIQAGSGGNDALRSLTQTATGAINAFGGLPAPLQKGALGFAAVTAGVLLTGGAVVTLVPKLVATNAALYGTEAAAARTALALRTVGIAAGAMALTAGLDLGIKKFNEFAQAKVPLDDMAKSLNELGRTGKLGKEGLDLFSVGVGPLRRGADDSADALRTFAQGAGEAFGSGTIDAINRFVQAGAPLDKFADKAKVIDAALGQLVTSGNADSAAVSFKKFSDIIIAQGGDVVDVAAMFPTYTAAMDSATVAATTATAPTAAMAQAERDTAQAADEAKKAHDALTASIVGYGSAMMTARGDARSYEAAIDAATASLKENGKTLDITTEKGRANQAALDGIATAALKAAESNLGLAEQNGKLGTATKTVTGDVNTARTAFIDAAMAMGTKTRPEAAKLADQAGLTAGRVKEITTKLIELGKQAPKPTVDVNATPALNKLGDVQRAIYDLHDKTVTMTVISVSKANAAGGGYITGPGTGTSDSIPANLSNGEFVVRAAAVKKVGLPALHQINSYAMGGPVSAPRHVSAPQYVSAPTSRASQSAVSVDVSGVRADLGVVANEVRNLGDRVGVELDRQARTIQTMQRQMARA